jgi:4-amino-4-deoxy-L-arabinose transferase-like glycosyltransferase
MLQQAKPLTDATPTAEPAGTADQSPPKAKVSPLLVILLAGAVVRLALWAWFQGCPIEIEDEREYNQIAVNLLVRGEFALEAGQPTSIRPPLYPAFVAAVYALFGRENYQAVRLLQAALSLANVLLLYRLGTDVLSRRAGLWLAGLFCFYPSFLGYDNLLLTEVLFTLLLCATCLLLVWSLQRQSLGCLVLAGLCLGLAALTRSVVWLFPPVLGAFLLLAWKGSLARRLVAAVAVAAAFAVTVAPWAVRNTRLQQTFVTIDTMGGRNFMMGNYRHTPLYRSWDAISLDGEQSWVAEVNATYPVVERQTQGQLDKLALRQGLAFVKANPGLTLRRDLVKFFDFWGLERELLAGAARGWFGSVGRPALLALTVLVLGSYALALIVGIFGMVLAPPADWRVHALLLLVIAFVCGIHTLVFAHSRYHLPIMPLVLVYTASAVVHARGIWQQRRRWRFWLAGGLGGVFVAGWLWLFVAVDLERYLTALGLST